MDRSGSEAPAVEIVPGVHWIERIWDVKVYVLCQENGAVVVDAAMPGRERVIWRHLAALGYGPADLNAVWLTHGDVDHAGSAAALQAESGAEVVAHHADVPMIQGQAGRALGPVPGRHWLERIFDWLVRDVVHYTPAVVDHPVEDGAELGAWSVVHVPGHTAGSICFHHAARGILIVGDAIRHRRGQLAAPPRVLAPYAAAAVDSVTRIAELDFEICCFGHGPPLVRDARARVRALAHRLS
ncbi:MAG: MBL fold metallo-hydrolase [Anaerolineae bacterium]|nr:MBL fold metallo-hydrolase [Anaerolineae bacterium]